MTRTGWTQKPIGAAGQVQAGRQRSPHHVDGKVRPYLRVANVGEGFIDTIDILEMCFTDEEFGRYVLKEGDVLLNEGQSLELVGRSAVYRGEPKDCCFQNTLIRFRANAETDPEFAHCLFEHLRKAGMFKAIAVQTTSIAHLGVDRFASVNAWWPPLAEQRRIMSVVRCWDRAISLRERQLAAAETLHCTLNRQLLSGGRRFAAWSDSLLEEVPLGEVTRESIRRNTAGLGVPSVRAVNKLRGMIPMRERTIGSDLSRYKIVRPDWFAYNPMRLNIGSLSRWKGAEDVLVSPDYVVFSCDTQRLLPDYFDHLRRSRLWEQFVTGAGNGSVRVRIYYGDIARLRFPLPDLPEQRKIADTLNTAERELCLLRQQIAALRTQKECVVKRLLGNQVTKEVAA